MYYMWHPQLQERLRGGQAVGSHNRNCVLVIDHCQSLTDTCTPSILLFVASFNNVPLLHQRSNFAISSTLTVYIYTVIHQCLYLTQLFIFVKPCFRPLIVPKPQ